MVSQIDLTAILKAKQGPVGHTALTISHHVGNNGLLANIRIGQKAIEAFGLCVIEGELADGLPPNSKQAIEKRVASLRQSLIFQPR